MRCPKCHHHHEDTPSCYKPKSSYFHAVMDHLRDEEEDIARSYTVEEIARYIESDSDCLMEIVVEQTKKAYGIQLLKVMASEIRKKFGRVEPVESPAPGDFEMTEQEASEFYHMPRAVEETQ